MNTLSVALLVASMLFILADVIFIKKDKSILLSCMSLVLLIFSAIFAEELETRFFIAITSFVLAIVSIITIYTDKEKTK